MVRGSSVGAFSRVGSLFVAPLRASCGRQRREGRAGDPILPTRGRNIPNLCGIQTPLTSILTRFWEKTPDTRSEPRRCTSQSEPWLCSGCHPSPAGLRFNATRRGGRDLRSTEQPQRVGIGCSRRPDTEKKLSVRACKGPPPPPTPSTRERCIKSQGQRSVPGL